MTCCAGDDDARDVSAFSRCVRCTARLASATDNFGGALLFAGSETGGRNGRGLTYANPIDVVLRKLAIALPTP